MWSLGFHGCFAVSSEGKSGGLALFWVQECIVSLKHYSPNIIDVTIGSEANQLWRVSFVYGEPRSELRHNFWDLLRFVRSQWSGPWLCAGDFNEVLSSDEHLSRGERGEQQMRLFRECLEDCELFDLGFSGPKYTWNNRQVGSDNVKVRLDRAVANGHFIQLFDDYHVENVITSTSDHYAILVSINRDSQYNDRSSFDNNFKYEAMWARAPDYNDIVEKKWKEDFEGPRNLQSFWSNLSRMATSLKHWSSRTFGSIRKEIKKLERQLAMLRSSSATPAFSVEERRIERKLCDLFECEEIMARQRSRVDWLQAGDRNTSFFHARASARRKTNRISYLLREDGTRCEDREELKGMVRDFYTTLFSAERCDHIDDILEAIPCKIDQSINEMLCKPYTDEEIREALFQMGPTKAPGPDGFPALFYQRHWDFLQADICTAVRDFLQGDAIPDGLCDTTIVLIPKISKPERLNNFRPISLCNVLYKIASKVLANRLKNFLPFIISEEQSAFVPGRLITDNVLVAYECMHTIRKQKANTPFFALKIDMMKAYDRVEWKYLQGVLSKMGFADGWIQTVMKCVTKVRYAIRVNGELSEPFIPTRGLRQGDPISPYLFLLCAEGLSCLMKKKEAEGKINGVKNGRTGPAISHLLFADDSIFFIRGDMKNLQALNEVLHLYSEGTGQQINFQKSSLFFGDKCPEQVKDRVKSYINVRNVVVQANYLGMPSWVGRSPTSTFNFLPERMWRKIRGWNDRPLSRAGKEVMFKSVIQAIPIYVMSCFRLPAAICDKMRTTISNHWWGIEEGKKKMHWRSWEWLTAPKAMGGMGFRDMQIFNQAMLGKQAWRILTVPNSLCARVLKGRYFPCCSFWDASQPRSSSFTWRSIMYGKELLMKGIIWRVGDGRTIRITRDYWVNDSSMLKPIVSISDNSNVYSLIDGAAGSWNEEMVRACFNEDDAEKILQIPLCHTPCEDFPAWLHTKSGIYTVKSAYFLARLESFHVFLGENGRGETSDQSKISKSWKRLWAIQAPPKMKIVLWRMAHDCLPTGSQLKKRHILDFDACCFCGREETVEHVFFMCQFASEIWRQVRKCFNINYKMHASANIRHWLFDFLEAAEDHEATVFAITVWHIWESRNAVRNGENMMHPQSIAQRAVAYIEMFLLHVTTKKSKV